MVEGKLARSRAAKGFTHLTDTTQLTWAYQDKTGVLYNALDQLKKATFVAFTNVEITEKDIRLTHLRAVNISVQ